MKLVPTLLTITIISVMITGCQNKQSEVEPSPFWQRDVMNRWSVHNYNNQSINNAIVSQHTLFPYHFTNNSEELNELGQRDLNVLAEHFAKYPGELNIRRGGIESDLYQLRIGSVTDLLADKGVDTSRIQIKNELAGGDGLVSERCVVILGAETTLPAYPASKNSESCSQKGEQQ